MEFYPPLNDQTIHYLLSTGCYLASQMQAFYIFSPDDEPLIHIRTRALAEIIKKSAAKYDIATSRYYL